MKKLVLTVLALTLAFSVTACGSKEEPTPESTPASTEAPAETGLALAVVPMLVAAATVVLSKKN